MIRGQRQRTLDLTQRILEEYWAGKKHLLYQYMDPDIVWIGSMDEEYIQGADNMRAHLDQLQKGRPVVCLDQEEFQVVSNDVKTCTVAGRYRAYTNPERGEVRSEKQRVTFCWRYENKELKIVHIHLSNADFPQEGGKQFPLQDSDENKEFMKMLMTQRSQSAMLTVKVCSGVTRVIDYTNIIYIKPAHNYSVIMCAEGEREIRVRQTLCELAEKLPNRFMQVSRSCVVNLHYVNRLEGRWLLLEDGTQLKVPERNRALVKRKMLWRGRE